jgi:hypothetical protein
MLAEFAHERDAQHRDYIHMQSFIGYLRQRPYRQPSVVVGIYTAKANQYFFD